MPADQVTTLLVPADERRAREILNATPFMPAVGYRGHGMSPTPLSTVADLLDSLEKLRDTLVVAAADYESLQRWRFDHERDLQGFGRVIREALERAQ